MTSTTGISAQSPYDPTTSLNAATSNSTLGKEDFLKLLVAQLSHQDPTKPTDPSEFVAQLSQFSSLEQLMNIKDGLDLVAVTETAGTSAQMVTFIGKEVSFDGGQVAWSKGKAPVELSYELADPAAKLEARIVDKNGTTLETRELGAASAGVKSFVFDGKKADGTALPDGTYTVELTAVDSSGDKTNVSLKTRGLVQAVTFSAGYPQLVLSDGRTVGLSQVLEVLANSETVVPSTSSGTASDPTHVDDATTTD